MRSDVARHCKSALEAPHAMIHFAPEAEQEFTELGLEKGWMAYFAGRAAAMGPVGPGVVSATFYNFNPEAVSAVIPRAWSIASPDEVITARFRAVDAALNRMLGAETLASASVTEALELASEAMRACTPEGKPLYAAHADLEWPNERHLQLWHALTLLREFRGDAHLAALQTAGLTGLQALVLHAAAGEGLNAAAAKMTRGWSDDQWSAVEGELSEKGLIDEDGSLSTAGKDLREQVEVTTDEQSMAPWRRLGQDKVERLIEHGSALSKQLVKAGAFPKSMFSAGSDRRE